VLARAHAGDGVHCQAQQRADQAHLDHHRNNRAARRQRHARPVCARSGDIWHCSRRGRSGIGWRVDEIALLLLAFGLGMLHSFDVDHLCAVASFATHARSVRQGVALGFFWAVGHSAAVLIFGVALLMLKLAVPDSFDTASECLVGLVLIAVGVWLVREACRRRDLHLHWHEHDGRRHYHLHSHRDGPGHAHTHTLTALGVLHGLAGTSTVMLLIPVSFARSATATLVYIALFSIGTVLSMTLFGAAAARLFGVFERWAGIARLLRGAVGAVSCVVGAIWIGGALS
jgi:ABC-type nickel/cobalt efflux system permease component RcnA